MASRYWVSISSTDPTLAANWHDSTGATGAPASGDDLYIVPIPGLALANISFADSSAVALNSLNITAGITIGTTDITSANFFGYWKIGATTVNIGTPTGASSGGSGRIKLNLGTGATTVNVTQTGTSTDSGYEAVRILAVNAANVLNLLAGTAGIATNLPGEVSTFATINAAGGTVNLGAGVTWTTGNAAGQSALTTNSGGATVNCASGSSATLKGASAITTINNNGTVNHNLRTGTMTTTINNYANGTIDFSGDPRTVTVTTLNMYPGCKTIFNPANPGHVTVTTRSLVECGTLTAS